MFLFSPSLAENQNSCFAYVYLLRWKNQLRWVFWKQVFLFVYLYFTLVWERFFGLGKVFLGNMSVWPYEAWFIPKWSLFVKWPMCLGTPSTSSKIKQALGELLITIWKIYVAFYRCCFLYQGESRCKFEPWFWNCLV